MRGIGVIFGVVVAGWAALAASGDTPLLVGGANSDNILIRDADAGTCDQVFADPNDGLTSSRTITPTPFGTILVSGYFNSDGVREFDATTGALIRVLPTLASGSGGILFVNTSPPKLLISNGQSINEYSYPTGTFIRTVYSASPNYVYSMLLDSNDDVLLHDYRQFKRIDYPAGTVLQTVDTPDDECQMRYGPDGNLYVSFFTADVVRRYNPTTLAGTVFASGSGLSDPTGIAFHPTTGRLYVASYYSGSIFVFNSNGSYHDVMLPCPQTDRPISLLFSASVQYCPERIDGDVNGDRRVDLLDLALLLTNFGTGCK
ncbi:MAG: hypothetical protein ACKVS9_15010 [Phycisphaerae bacterium]